MAGLPGVTDLRVEDRILHCQVETDHLTELLSRLGTVGVKNLVSQPPTLEELFLGYYGEASGEVEPGTPAP